MDLALDPQFWLLTALAAGLIDSIGGGLVLRRRPCSICTRACTSCRPSATQRTRSIFGTSVAVWHYLRRLRIERRIVVSGKPEARHFIMKRNADLRGRLNDRHRSATFVMARTSPTFIEKPDTRTKPFPLPTSKSFKQLDER